MKYFILTSVFVLILILSGCSANTAVINTSDQTCDMYHSEMCDRSCQADSDCRPACPIGCINKNQSYANPREIDCTLFLCKCLGGACQPQYEFVE